MSNGKILLMEFLYYKVYIIKVRDAICEIVHNLFTIQLFVISPNEDNKIQLYTSLQNQN
jgi:hypothetical protein